MLRRSFLKGVGALFIAPAIIRAESLMPIKEYAPSVPSWCPDGWLPLDGREIKKKFYPDLYTMLEKQRLPMTLGSQLPAYAPEFGFHRVRSIERMIVAYKDMVRSNGTLMRAGHTYSLLVPTERLS